MPEGKIVKALSGFYYVFMMDKSFNAVEEVFFGKTKSPRLSAMKWFFKLKMTEGYIMEVKERKNELVRPPIANVDQAILVFSAVEPDFSTTLLDRFLVLVEYNRIGPLICITKMDLTDEDEKKAIENMQINTEILVMKYYLLLQKQKQELELLPYLEKISVFAGQSGVGKSSLLNVLRPELTLKQMKFPPI